MSTSAARDARVAFERLLETDAPGLQAMLPTGFADAAEAWVDLLLAANKRLNLTRIVEPEAIARLHLLDSIAALPVVDTLAPRRCLDLGSGGGVPGIPLAIARPDAAWVLVDSVRKKADILASFVAELGLANVAVRAERAEILGRDPGHRETYDLVTARACAALPVLAEYALPLLRIGGSLLAWKGPMTADELRAGRAAAAELGSAEVELRDPRIAALDHHQFVVVRKLEATPALYPRRPGRAAQHPLGQRVG